MTYIEFDKWLLNLARKMPRAMNDRAAQQQATQAANTASSEAAGVYGPLTTFAKGMMTAPPGYGADLPNMQAIAGEEASSAANNARQASSLAAARSGNAAGLNAAQDAAVQNASLVGGENQQNILAQNAQLKQEQMGEGAGILSGIFGTTTNVQPGDINAEVNAGESGWLQNLTGILGSLGQLGQGVGGAAKGFA